ncbi:hypothetical protein CV770_02320 [Bradyrhizobium sp. AC87j1]|uniref:hypothetical protein n=1 Tax=Bradyrhizobium sp. AC87j1 TaxID=2055894 RepID=UPI000CEC306B|nr:hypothetical protein [Bradyrhizobium sp. AC87j1]PPQ21092.1 hypothetical protein CV770_02320 [Bradyrhizobium sp. AC87j1]
MAKLPTKAELDLTTLTGVFTANKNPAAAWAAYSLARRHGLPVPGVIQAEVDRFASCIGKVAEQAMQTELGAPPIRFRAEELSQAWRSSGGDNPVGSLQGEWRDYKIFLAVYERVEGGMKVGAAQAAVAADKGVGVGIESIKKIWKRLKRDV